MQHYVSVYCSANQFLRPVNIYRICDVNSLLGRSLQVIPKPCWFVYYKQRIFLNNYVCILLRGRLKWPCIVITAMKRQWSILVMKRKQSVFEIRNFQYCVQYWSGLTADDIVCNTARRVIDCTTDLCLVTYWMFLLAASRDWRDFDTADAEGQKIYFSFAFYPSYLRDGLVITFTTYDQFVPQEMAL